MIDQHMQRATMVALSLKHLPANFEEHHRLLYEDIGMQWAEHGTEDARKMYADNPAATAAVMQFVDTVLRALDAGWAAQNNSKPYYHVRNMGQSALRNSGAGYRRKKRG